MMRDVIGPGPQPSSRMEVAFAKGERSFVRSTRTLTAAGPGPEENFWYSSASLFQSSPLAVGGRGLDKWSEVKISSE